jgi:hypothetical protein
VVLTALLMFALASLIRRAGRGGTMEARS